MAQGLNFTSTDIRIINKVACRLNHNIVAFLCELRCLNNSKLSLFYIVTYPSASLYSVGQIVTQFIAESDPI